MIDDTVMSGRIPRVGTITTGRGVEASSKAGKAYSRPSRSDTLVFHCDDGEVANAVQVKYGGSVVSSSLTWAYDVVTEATRVEVQMLPAGFRQSLELWSAAQCLRRCDGVNMSTFEGQPVSKPCMCSASAEDRDCKPHTVLPVLVDLDVPRFGVWEVKSTGWGSAANLKGTVQALQLTGRAVTTVPGVVEMRERLVKDSKGETHKVHELHAHIAVSADNIAALPTGNVAAITGGQPDVFQEWEGLLDFASSIGETERLRVQYAEMFGDVRTHELSEADMRVWVDYVTTYLNSLPVEESDQLV